MLARQAGRQKVAQAELSELKEIIRRTIRVRRITLGSFFAVAVVVRLALELRFPLPLLFAPLFWLIMTYPFKALIEAQRSEQGLHWTHAGFFILELGIITYLIHFLQGAEWLGLIFYIFTIIYANFFLPELQGYLITALAVLFYAALILLEWAGLIPHRTLFPARDYRSLSYVLTTILAGGAGIYAVLAYTIRIFAEIYRRKGRELAALSAKLISAQEEERRRIAHRLHDELGGALTAIKMDLELLAKEAKEGLQPRLRENARLLGEALAQARELSHSLRPPLLEELGLGPALRALGERFAEAGEFEIELELEEPGRLRPEVEGLIYRAAQEALTNAAKHSQARRVVLRLRRTKGQLRLEVEDNGRGFDPRRVVFQGGGGLGLQGMRERAILAGGSLRIESKAGRGTRVTLELPLDER
ncbi:MAG: sensor histidine kinase [Candidatus Bipolaricaulia bacterium]